MFGLFRSRKSRHGARGYGQSTRTCAHLKDGRELGWFVSPGLADDDYWPLAWCGDCNEIVEAAGGIERAVRALPIVTACDVCYEEKRDRNWPTNTAFSRSQTLGPWKTDHELRNRALAAEHDLAQYDWSDWEEVGDSVPRLILRKRASGKRVAVTAQSLGTFSRKTETWLWTWGQPKATEPVKGPLREIRAYGRRMGSLKLGCAHWPGTERDVFEMTAIAASFIPCLGEYRLPTARGYLVLLVLAVEPLAAVEPSPTVFGTA